MSSPLVTPSPSHQKSPLPQNQRSFLPEFRLISVLHHFAHELGAITLFTVQLLKRADLAPDQRSAIARQIVLVCQRSLGTVISAGLFVGAILVLQFNVILAQYDAQIFLGGLNTSSVIREVGPLIISFLIAGKIGAYTTAELGTMKVTEQMDAMECLGAQPLRELIAPRFIGIIVSSVLLLFIGLMVSILGAIAVAKIFCGVNPLQFISSIPKFTTMGTLFAGMFKSFVYGCIVASVSCFKGYTTSGGARGVGRAVTQASIYTNLYIVIANYGTSQIIRTLTEISDALIGK